MKKIKDLPPGSVFMILSYDSIRGNVYNTIYKKGNKDYIGFGNNRFSWQSLNQYTLVNTVDVEGMLVALTKDEL